MQPPLDRPHVQAVVDSAFVHGDLARACIVNTADPIRRVLLLGRLSLCTGRGPRDLLHDEILAVTAGWREPKQRVEGLKPYAHETEAKTLDLLDEALRDPAHSTDSDALSDRLKLCVAQDVKELLSHLEARAQAAFELLGSRLGCPHDRGTWVLICSE